MKKFLTFNLKPGRATEDIVFDLVCGMEMLKRETKFSFAYNGETYYFCSANCRAHFKEAPERYLGEE